MTSLYLGKVTSRDKPYEIHAVTKDVGFREYNTSEIADNNLYQKILEGRFEVLESGKPIFCTAINPDYEKKIEENPHDSREGTVHIIAISQTGEIAASLSVAVDLGQKHNGKFIGVPLENAWKQNGYSIGASLDKFRKKYLRYMYDKDKDIRPWEMAELYRHYKKTPRGDIAPRLGLYAGWYHLGVREARKKGKIPTSLWVFDAIPQYFNLYKLIGKAVLRDFVTKNPSRSLSPKSQQLESQQINGYEEVFCCGEKISRLLKVLMPVQGTKEWTHEDVPFLDGVVDMNRLENDIEKGAILTSYKGRNGFSIDDKIKMRIGAGVAAQRAFETHHPNNIFSKAINQIALKQIGASEWNFNEIG
jgi:hypothetical protein